jgi:hypothetical protein
MIQASTQQLAFLKENGFTRLEACEEYHDYERIVDGFGADGRNRMERITLAVDICPTENGKWNATVAHHPGDDHALCELEDTHNASSPDFNSPEECLEWLNKDAAELKAKIEAEPATKGENQ